MYGINESLGSLTPASASTDQILVFEQRRRGDTNISNTAPLRVNEVTVASAASLSGGAFTLADTLASSTEDGTPLEFSLTSATLDDAAVPGTLVIVGEDDTGTSITLTLSVANTALTTKHYTEVRFTEITSITPDGFSAGTCTVVALGATSGGHAFPLQPLVNEGDLALTGELIPLEYKSGNASSKKGAPGPLDVANGLTLAAIGDAGVLLPLSLIMQPKRIDWHIRNGTGKTFPADITVLDELQVATRTKAATQTVRRTLDANLSTSANPRQITLTPVTPIVVVDAADISSNAAASVANDLGTDRDTAVPLEVVLTDTPGLANTATPGTITIVGEDAAGQSQTEVLSFANTALTTAQVTEKVWTEITSVTPAGFNSGDVTVRELPLALTAGAIEGEVFIIGTDANDNKIGEQVGVRASQLTATLTTDMYFKTVTEVRCTDLASGLYKATARDRAVVVKMRPQDEEAFRYWTIEYVKGINPNVYRDLIATSLSFSIGSNTEAILYTMAFIGGKGETYTNIAGQKHDDLQIPPFYPKKTERDSALKFSAPDFFPSWNSKILIDGVQLYITSASFSYEAGIVNGDAISGDQFQTAPPTRDAVRSLMLDLTIQYSRENDFSGVFRRNATLDDVEVHLQNQPEGGFPELQIWRFLTAQIQNSADPATSGQSRITQQVQLKAFDNDFGNPKDVEVELHLPALVLPRIF